MSDRQASAAAYDVANDDIGELATEYGISLAPPPPAARKEAEQSCAAPVKQGKRTDLTGLPLITIDGADAKDFDDAVHCSRAGSGFRLTVAIADVASYVAADGALEADARERATSVYFPGQRAIPMLPAALSEDRCSLRPQQLRLALACEMELDAQGEVGKYRFFECAMRSAARLTYPEAEAMLEQPAGKDDAVAESLAALAQLARLLLKRRQRDGSLVLELPVIEPEFDQHGALKGVKTLERRLFSQQLIEECMLVANCCAARFLREQGQQFLYRVHKRPDAAKAARLRDVLEGAGLRCSAADPATLVMQAGESIAAIEDVQLRKVLLLNVLQALERASYTPDNAGHFGLGFDEYAHFTSPIRRYPDLQVHRAIKRALRQRSRPAASSSRLNELCALGEHCSQKELAAERAGMDYVARQVGRLLRSKQGMEAEGIISGMSKGGMFISFAGQHEGMVRFASLDDYYVLNQHRTRAEGRRQRRCYRIGMRVKVRIAAVDAASGRCELALL